jgi:fatty-acyl-CoA synthase
MTGAQMTAATTAPSYVSGTSTVPLLGETIGEILERIAATYPDREALVDCPRNLRWTYAEFDAAVNALATGLLGLGLSKDERVGIWSPNCAEWTITQFATARIGAVLVTVNPAYRTHELGYALKQSGCSMLVSATAFKTSDYAAMVDQVRGDCPELRDVIFIGSPAWDALAASAADEAALRERAAALAFDDAINIQYTSGTTGFPKGATLSHHNIANNGFFVGELCGYTEADRVCIPVPFYHCFGMVMGNLGAVSHGATMVIPAPSFDPAATLAAVQNEKCTSLYGVPTMFIGELALPDFASYDLSALRTGIMAGSPCPVEVMKRVV